MKKFLFTLAALCAFGFANAEMLPQSEPAPDLGFRLNGELINEVTLAPGESVEVTLTIEKMYLTMASGVQLQWRMYDAEHNAILYTNTDKVNPVKVYGNRPKTWFKSIDHGTSTYNDGLNIGSATPGQGDLANNYRIMATNTQSNMCFFRFDENDNEMFAQNIGVFTMQASENWDEEFATFELDKTYALWNVCPDYDYNVFEEARYADDYEMILKVKNANYTPAQPDEVADPVITFAGETTTTMTVTVTCETEGATLVVNGETINANTYTYTVDRDDVYTAGTVSCTAQSFYGTAESAPVTESKDWVVADPMPAIVPVITFTEDATGVAINVTDATSYYVTVDGENVGAVTHVDADYKAHDIHVYAVNETPNHVKGENDDAFALAALEKKAVDAPVITTTMDDDFVYVHITWPAETDGEQVYTGEYQYARGQYDYEVPVTAYVKEGTEWKASAETNYTVEVPNNWKVYETATPTATTDMDADYFYVNASGEGNVVLYVTVYDPETGDPTTTQYPGVGTAQAKIERGTEDVTISYYVTATADVEGYDEVVPASSVAAYATVPAKQTTPVEPTEVGAPTFQGYTIDGITGYGTYIIPTTAGSSIKYRVLVWNATTETWDLLTDWTDYTGDEGEIYYNTIGAKYRVEAYAYYGDLRSEDVSYEFVVQVPSSIDEMMGGKTVANVRYFNMAGQEMQEANGVTIVVTTYTDGTTNAVKVMK